MSCGTGCTWTRGCRAGSGAGRVDPPPVYDCLVAPRQLHEHDYFRVLADDTARVVRLVRSVTPFSSIDAIEQTFDAVDRAITSIPPDWALLIDSRDGPLRNDPVFEDILARARGRIIGRFTRVAVLVRSAIGKLQVGRYSREDRKPPTVFDDEAEALAFLAARRSIAPTGRSGR
jgi:hypothetical protein